VFPDFGIARTSKLHHEFAGVGNLARLAASESVQSHGLLSVRVGFTVGLMFFPDPSRGITEFHRVLRPGGRAAISVNTVPERSYNNHINLAIARHVPSLMAAAARVFSLGDETKLKSLFEAANFRDVEITMKRIVSCCLRSTPTSSRSSKEGARLGRHWPRCQRRPAALCGKKYGATWVIEAEQLR
jgi:hypothetical protein